jgi:hypothetical protein
MNRADISQGYKFRSISETALINLVGKFYTLKYDETLAEIELRLKKRAERLAKSVATADPETPATDPAK